MPDITMCQGVGCHKKNSCYRNTAKPSDGYQSYFMESPIKGKSECSYFMPNENASRLQVKLGGK